MGEARKVASVAIDHSTERKGGHSGSTKERKSKVHFAALMDICHLKNAELKRKYQKYKGVVLRGDIVKGRTVPLTQIEGRTAHFCNTHVTYLMSKNSESHKRFSKHKGRVVVRKGAAKDESGSIAVYTEQGSSASHRTSVQCWMSLQGCQTMQANPAILFLLTPR